MHRQLTLLVGALLAAAALIGASPANANRSIGLNSAIYFLTTSALTLGTAVGFSAICSGSAEVTMTRSFPKTEGRVVGNYTGMGIACPRSSNPLLFWVESVTILGLGDPTAWAIAYRSFEGTLPRIRNVSFMVRSARILIRATIFGSRASCLYRGDAAMVWGTAPPAEGREPIFLFDARLSAISCPEYITIKAPFTITPAPRFSLL